MIDASQIDWVTYLNANPDVKRAVDAGLISAQDHWERHGQHEGRSLGFQPQVANQGQHYNAVLGTPIGPTNAAEMQAFQDGTFTPTNPNAQAQNASTATASAAMPEGFNAEWYGRQYQDVTDAGMDPWQHFQTYGQYENRAVNPLHMQYMQGQYDFDPNAYGQANSDVLNAVAGGSIPGLDDHYFMYGMGEGRPLGTTATAPDPHPVQSEDPFDPEAFQQQLTNGFQNQFSQWGQQFQNQLNGLNQPQSNGWDQIGGFLGGILDRFNTPQPGTNTAGDPADYAATNWMTPYNQSPTLSPVYQPNQGNPQNGFAPSWNQSNPFNIGTF